MYKAEKMLTVMQGSESNQKKHVWYHIIQNIVLKCNISLNLDNAANKTIITGDSALLKSLKTSVHDTVLMLNKLYMAIFDAI